MYMKIIYKSVEKKLTFFRCLVCPYIFAGLSCKYEFSVLRSLEDVPHLMAGMMKKNSDVSVWIPVLLLSIGY